MATVLEVSNLVKSYGKLKAVDGINFSIQEGQIFGLLGPNGAGKTTTVEIIEGLRKPDSGEISVCGINIQANPEKIKPLIGVQLQTTTIYDRIKVGEAIELFGSYYRNSINTEKILKMVSLKDKADSYYVTLSGGQKQRMAMALALVNDPRILFLDEPTTGLDPQARRNIWSVIEDLKQQGKTVILTTHYMEEAEHLCDTVGIIDYGKIIAMDSPANLINNTGLESSIEFNCSQDDYHKITSQLEGISKSERRGNKSILYTRDSTRALSQLTNIAQANNLILENIHTRGATLEDVFLHLTGRKIREN